MKKQLSQTHILRVKNPFWSNQNQIVNPKPRINQVRPVQLKSSILSHHKAEVLREPHLHRHKLFRAEGQVELL